MTAAWPARLLACLVVVHVVWGLVRIPGKVFARRWQDVQTYERLGAAGFLLGQEHYGGQDAIGWVLRNTPPQSVVLWDGQPNGPLEFAAGLLAPRLLVAVGHCDPANGSYAGLPVARAESDGRRGAVVLVATAKDLRVEVR